MQIVYITHHSILHAAAFAVWLSWLIVGGALYGVFRFVLDICVLTGAFGLGDQSRRDAGEPRGSGDYSSPN